MIYSLIALVSGGTVAVSILLNARLGAVKGLYKGVFVNYMMGSLLAIPLAFIISGLKIPVINFNLTLLIALSGGVIGYVVVILNSHLTPKIGILYVTVMLFIGQIGTGIVIDGIRDGHFSLGKVTGSLLITAGLVYLLRLERVKAE